MCIYYFVISLALTTAVWKGSPSCKFGPSCVASEGTENGGLCCPFRLPGTRLAVWDSDLVAVTFVNVGVLSRELGLSLGPNNRLAGVDGQIQIDWFSNFKTRNSN